MQWNLTLLILMGQCVFLVCHLYEYHFINESKNWEDAKNDCKKRYTDLATVFDMNDMWRLEMKGKKKNNKQMNEDAWIGLKREQTNKTWHWSLPGVEFSNNQTNWKPGEPNDCGGQENCGMIDSHGKWNDAKCEENLLFICYNESQENKYHLINIKYTWQQAQNYCRANYTDLVSGYSQLNDTEFEQERNGNEVWMGLFRVRWSWSDGSRFSFRNWHNEFSDDNSTKCAVTTKNGKWKASKCDKTKPYYCYKDKMILITENKTWVEALNYCREKHHDLVSITNLTEQNWVQEKVKNASSRYVWLGLRYTCTLDFWFWVTDEVVSYKNWASEPKGVCDLSGAMDRQGGHKWVNVSDEETYNFICSTE